jgi:hypothetical protein
MNVVDAFVVTLGLDASKFKEGAKQTDEALGKTAGSVQKTGKDMEAWGKNAAASMSKLRNEVLGLLAVFTAGMGIKDFVSSTISSTASLGRMSANLNMTAKSLAEFHLANKNAGGSVEAMTALLGDQQKAVSDYKLGANNASTAAFRSSGLAKESDFKDAETLLLAKSDAIKKIIDAQGIDVGRSMAASFGISADTFNLIKQGSGAINEARRSVESLASAQAAASVPAEEFRKKWDLVQNRLESVGVNIVTQLLPVLNRFADWLAANQDQIAEWGAKVAKAVQVVSGLIVGAMSIVSPLLETSAQGWKNIYGWVKLIGEAISKLLPPAWLEKIGSGTSWLFEKLGIKDAVDKMLEPTAAASAKTSPTAAIPATGGAAQGQIVDSLMAKGWTREQSVGIAANLKQESNFNANASGDGGKAYGIAQWHGDRQAEFKKQYGKDIKESSLEEQLVFLNHELRQGSEQAAGNKLKGATSVQDAAGIVSKHFERPRDTDVEIARRAQIATQIDAQERTRIAAASAANVVRMASVAGSKPNAGGNSTSSSQVNINGPINIATKATDADGIAKGIGPAITKHSFAFQANTGLA